MSSKSQPVSEGESRAPVRSQPVNPLKNPSYPQRIHTHEKPHWEGILLYCEERLNKARKKLNVLGASPHRATFERLYFQMEGARDQVAEAARRMPTEAGDLYAEDHHLAEEAVATIDRIFQRWDSQSTS